MKYFSSLLAALLITCTVQAQVTAIDDVIICTPQQVSLSATVNGQLGTTAYTVGSFTYTPETYAGAAVTLSDDAISASLPIGFSFCFLGNTYTNFYIGSNGWVGFSAGQPTAFTSASIPSAAANVPKNCIMGPWQDWLPGSTIKYQTIGTAPNRKLVVSWDNSPMFSCTANLGKFQIVLHESSNIIENHLTNKPTCAWAGGTATMGIHNATGTAAFVVPGRNSTNWTATNESWRYTPNGVVWTTLGGTPVGTGLSINVTPQITTTYVVTVPLCGAATVTDQVTVTVGAGINYANTQITGSSCTNATGNIVLNVTGGSGGPFTYSWDIPGGSTDNAVYDLPPGDYTVTVTDQSNGCTDEETFELPENNTLLLTTDFDAPSCNGANDGSATVSAESNFPNYTYQWNDPAGQTTAVATGLAAGFYSVTVTDSDGCISNAIINITQPSAISIGNPTIINASCNGAANGAIDINPTGGAAGYEYEWSNGATSDINPGLVAGDYVVTIIDANGCELESTLTITEPEVLTASSVIDNVSCSGYSDGSAEVIAVGGTSPYTYTWTELGVTGPIQNNLLPGNYEIVVTDNNGCQYFEQIQVSASTSLLVTSVIEQVSCFGEADGSATVEVNGGTPDYTYSWNDPNNQSSATAVNLAPGTYTVSVFDANNCQALYDVVITEPQDLAITIVSQDDVECFGQANGEVQIQVNGGTAPYSYNWSGGQQLPIVSTLSAGLQIITVTDANGCTVGGSVQIGQPAAVGATYTTTNPTCYDGLNGSATVVASGGVGGYTYDWAGSPSSTATANNLGAGQYTAIITDANGCQHSVSILITEPSEIIVTTSSVSATCGLEDGSVTANGFGGTGNLSYNWGNIGTGGTINDIGAGSYTVTVTDANGCTSNATVNVTTINTPQAAIEANVLEGYMPLGVVFTNLSTNGSIYNWDFGDGGSFSSSSTESVNHIFNNQGTYTVVLTITNEGGCTDAAFVEILVYDLAILNIPDVITPNGDGLNEEFKFGFNSIKTFECAIYNRWGNEVYRWSDLTKGWNGKNKGGQDEPEGTYYYVIKAEGFDGTVYDLDGHLTILR
jgi:gliding motility-associated-like protein